MDEVEDLINDSNSEDEDEETASLLDKFIEEHRKYEALMKKAYIDGIETLIKSERDRMNKIREKMRRYFDNLLASKLVNLKLKDKLFDLKLKVNEDEGAMREQLRDQKFKDLETLIEGLLEDVKTDLKDDDAVMLESFKVAYEDISEIQLKLKKGNMESLTQDEIQKLGESEEKIKHYLKLLKNSKNIDDSLKEKLLEIEKLLNQKKNILSNKAQAEKLDKNKQQLNDLTDELEKMKAMDAYIKDMLKKLKRAQLEMAQLLDIVLEEGMESLEKRELDRLEVLKKEVRDALEAIEDDPSVPIAAKVKLTQIEKHNKETIKQVESISLQKSTGDIFMILQNIIDNEDTDDKLKDYLNNIKDLQKKIDKLKKKLVDEDSLSKLEIERLRELEEDIKKKIEQLKDSQDLEDSAKDQVEKLLEKKKSAQTYLKEKLDEIEKKDEFESIDDIEKMLVRLKVQVTDDKKCAKCCDDLPDGDLLEASAVRHQVRGFDPEGDLSSVRFETFLPGDMVLKKYQEVRDSGGDNTTLSINVSREQLLMMAN